MASARGDGQGLGALVFEHPAHDVNKTQCRRGELSRDCNKLATLMRDRRLPLFFLDACQTARAETDPTSSVAGTLLQSGAASVVAMSHGVLVETAKRFVGRFTGPCCKATASERRCWPDRGPCTTPPSRGRGFGGELRLQDWFVPVLFQEETDPQLVRRVPAQQVQDEFRKHHVRNYGAVLEPPPHGFVGRSRELLGR